MKTTMLTFTVTPEEKKRIEEAARQGYRNTSQQLRKMIEDWFKQKEAEDGQVVGYSHCR